MFNVRLLFKLFAFSLAAATPAVFAADVGTIQGRVLNSTNGTYLNNARVTIDGTAIETFTNEIGEYRLSNVPAGTVAVRAAAGVVSTQPVGGAEASR